MSIFIGFVVKGREVGRKVEMRVLFLGSDPDESNRLRLDEELRALKCARDSSKYRDRVALDIGPAARLDDAISLMHRYNPTVLHYSGHGTPAGEYLHTGEDLSPKRVDAETVCRMLSVAQLPVKLLVCNFCYSAVVAERAMEHVEAAIGFDASVDDRHACRFSKDFYASLWDGCSVGKAFAQAAFQLEAAFDGDAAAPRLFVRKGQNAEELFLFEADSFEFASAENREIGERLQNVLDMVNEGLRGSEEIDLAYVAEHIADDDDCARMSAYFSGTEAQSLKFLDDFASYFGASSEWLKRGKGSPFPLRRFSHPRECMEVIERENPERIYFVLCDSARKEAALIVGGGFRYETIGNPDWPLALRNAFEASIANVGGGGKRNILEFQSLIKWVYGQGPVPMSIVVDADTWDSLMAGTMFPLAAIRKKRGSSYWADDLEDAERVDPGREEQCRKANGDWITITRQFLRDACSDVPARPL